VSSVSSKPARCRLPTSTGPDRNIGLAMREAIRVMRTYEATDTDRQLAVRDLELAIVEHDRAVLKRRVEARK
jgi:hypothetical protein